VARLVDFGISAMARNTAKVTINSSSGTENYCAPELFEDPYESITLSMPTVKSDMWAFALLIWEACSGSCLWL
jgi:serine/threonine protein kinase